MAMDLLLENYLGCLIKTHIPEPHLRTLNWSPEEEGGKEAWKLAHSV